MIEVTGNLWTYPADWRVITTNGFVKKNGECVMGRGCAKEARDKFPGFAKQLGHAIQTHGNRLWVWPEHMLITFPVKHNWFEKADPLLIIESTKLLKDWVGSRSVLMPRPGCGNGQLRWEDVRPLLAALPDNVKVITFA